MARITVEDCIDKFDSRFELVLVASNRARKLLSGEQPTVEKDNDKNTVIALREIAEETISADEFKQSLVEEYQSVSQIDEEELALEFNEEITDQEEVTDQVENTHELDNADEVSDIDTEIFDESVVNKEEELEASKKPITDTNENEISDDISAIQTDQNS